MKKKLLLGVGALVLLGVAAVGGAFAATFSGLSPVKPVTELPGGAWGVANEGFVQAFILPAGEGRAVLVDCGADPEAKALKAKLGELKLTPVAAVLTHGHGDHVGGCLAFPGLEVYALETERAVVEGTASPRGPAVKFSRNDPAKSPRLKRGLVDGEVLEVGAARVQVFALAGHTAGSAAYLASGVLFLGDAASAGKDGKLLGPMWIFSDDAGQGAASLRALSKRLSASGAEVKALAPSHSGPLEGMGALGAY